MSPTEAHPQVKLWPRVLFAVGLVVSAEVLVNPTDTVGAVVNQMQEHLLPHDVWCDESRTQLVTIGSGEDWDNLLGIADPGHNLNQGALGVAIRDMTGYDNPAPIPGDVIKGFPLPGTCHE